MNKRTVLFTVSSKYFPLIRYDAIMWGTFQKNTEIEKPNCDGYFGLKNQNELNKVKTNITI